jgi:predicted short-subunit dehydrogenase-like oxidoreductase (DUF2520 family)
MARTSSKPSVSIVGAGRLGSALALALDATGYSIETVVARRQSSATRAARLLDVAPRALAAKDIDQLQLTDIIIIATPDDLIADVGASLLDVEPASTESCAVLHTSGALSSVILSPLKRRKWSVGSVHPLVSVSSGKTGAASLKDGFWSVEGDRKAVGVARKLVRDLKGHSFTVNSQKKPLYHAAALMAAGGVVALFDVAVEMMIHSGVDRAMARKVLQPLIESVVQSLGSKDTPEALTGTFSRGDIKTVIHHLEVLNEQTDLEVAQQLYKILGQRELKLAQQKNLSARVAKEIEKLLNQS